MTDKSEIIITRVCKIISVGSVSSTRTCTQTNGIYLIGEKKTGVNFSRVKLLVGEKISRL